MKKLDVNMKVLIAIIALFGLSLNLMAQPPQKQRQMQYRDCEGPAMLDLTEDQKTEFKAIQLARLKAVQPMTDEVKINKAKINAAMNTDNPDMKEIAGLVEANGKLMTDIRLNKLESRIKVRSILTEDQKVIFDARAGQSKKHRTGAQHRMGNMGRMNGMGGMNGMGRMDRAGRMECLYR